MKIAVFQFSPIVGALTYNSDRLLSAIKEAQANHCDLFVCPELCLTGYPPEDLLLRADFASRIQDLIKPIFKISNLTIMLPLPYYEAGKIYNSVLVIRDGIVITRYDKMVLPNYGVFDDKRYFEAGSKAGVFECANYKIGIIICEDMWLTAPAMLAKEHGVDLLCVVNASPYEEGKYHQRLASARQRVAQTDAALLYVNCVGGQDELVYDGGSFLLNEVGEVCYQATAFEAALDYISYTKKCNSSKGGNLVNLVADYPSYLEANYAALVLAVRDYVTRNKFTQVVIGLSGGVDSALVLAIAVDALGADKVIAVMMPSVYTNKISIEDAREITKRFGVTCYHELDIMPAFNQFNTSLSDIFSGRAIDTTEENLQARIRGTLLMAIANKFNALVLTTGNKSEMATGYATLYGDMAGGFAVLKDLLKTMVYALCNWRNRLCEVIPNRIITRAPSAELRANQIDQDSLPDYETLDQIIIELVDNNQSSSAIIASGRFTKEQVLKVAHLIKINEHKRQQAAVGPKITPRSFAKDWRYPITSGYEL